MWTGGGRDLNTIEANEQSEAWHWIGDRFLYLESDLPWLAGTEHLIQNQKLWGFQQHPAVSFPATPVKRQDKHKLDILPVEVECESSR